jgi:hypothetical protein
MTYLQSFSTVDLSENESYVSESVGYEPGVQVGEEEVKSGVRGNDGNMLPDLNEEYVEEQESFFVPPSYPQYTYGSYHSRGNRAKDLEEDYNGSNPNDDNQEDAYEDVNIKVEPNPDVSYETEQVRLFIYTSISLHVLGFAGLN